MLITESKIKKFHSFLHWDNRQISRVFSMKQWHHVTDMHYDNKPRTSKAILFYWAKLKQYSYPNATWLFDTFPGMNKCIIFSFYNIQPIYTHIISGNSVRCVFLIKKNSLDSCSAHRECENCCICLPQQQFDP